MRRNEDEQGGMRRKKEEWAVVRRSNEKWGGVRRSKDVEEVGEAGRWKWRDSAGLTCLLGHFWLSYSAHSTRLAYWSTIVTWQKWVIAHLVEARVIPTLWRDQERAVRVRTRRKDLKAGVGRISISIWMSHPGLISTVIPDIYIFSGYPYPEISSRDWFAKYTHRLPVHCL